MTGHQDLPADLPADWLVPDWPAPPNVRAVFTARSGGFGFSSPPYDSLNLGVHVGDAPDDVAQNRLALQRAIGAAPVFMNQVHGQTVLHVNSATAHGLAADASVAHQERVACTVMVADCLPVLLAHRDVAVVAAAHAGWRGLSGRLPGSPAKESASAGVLASTFDSFVSVVNAALPSPLPREAVAARTLVWLGPCIGPQAFEVGADVKAAFEAVEPEAATCFASHKAAAGKFLADLAGLARLRLAGLGIGLDQVYGNDGSEAWCTVNQASRFFSHRRSGHGAASGVGGTGRMAACIWLV